MLPWPWQAWVREYFFQLENGSFNKNDIIFQCELKRGSLFETRDFKNTMFWWDFMLLPTSPQSVAPVCWLFVTPDRCLEKEQHLGGFILGLKCYWWSRRLKTFHDQLKSDSFLFFWMNILSYYPSILRFTIGIYRESTHQDFMVRFPQGFWPLTLAGAEAFGEAVSSNHALQRLDLSNNGIKGAGAQQTTEINGTYAWFMVKIV